MEEQLSSLVFGFSVIGLSIIESKRFNNLITPFTVTAIPLVLISIAVNFVFIHIDVKPVTMRVIFFYY